jgi:DNA-binding response OmpR family regulator
MPRSFAPIIYVEDDPADRKRFRDEIAKYLSNHVDYLSSAEDFLARLDEGMPETPPIMLIDIVLPGMSGYELVSTVRNRHKHLDMSPLIIVTGDYNATTKSTAKAVGADWFIGKPITVFTLIDALKHVGKYELGIVDRRHE